MFQLNCLVNDDNLDPKSKSWSLLQYLTPPPGGPGLLLPRPQQGELHPPWRLGLLPRQPAEAPVPLHGPADPQPHSLSRRELLRPGNAVRREPRRLPGSGRRLCRAGRRIGRGARLLITAAALFCENDDANVYLDQDRCV